MITSIPLETYYTPILTLTAFGGVSLSRISEPTYHRYSTPRRPCLSCGAPAEASDAPCSYCKSPPSYAVIHGGGYSSK